MKRILAPLVGAILMFSSGMAWALPACQERPYDNCFGTHTWASGNKYVGEWKNGTRHGQGSVTFGASSRWAGSKYIGGFRNGKFHGHGVYRQANGDKYDGEHRNGKPNGQGIYTFGPSSPWAGDKYDGEYRNGKRHGQGTYTHADGRIYEGIWKEGKFQYAQKVTRPVFTVKPGVQPEKTDDGSATELEKKLSTLKKLLDKGLITNEEVAAKRKEVLERASVGQRLVRSGAGNRMNSSVPSQMDLKQMAVDLKWASDCQLGGTYARIGSLAEKARKKLDGKSRRIWDDATSKAIEDEDRYQEPEPGWAFPIPLDCTKKEVEKVITRATAFVQNFKPKTSTYTKRSTLIRLLLKDIEQMAVDLKWASECQISGMFERVEALVEKAKNQLNSEGRRIWEDAALAAQYNETRYAPLSNPDEYGPINCTRKEVEKVIASVTATLDKSPASKPTTQAAREEKSPKKGVTNSGRLTKEERPYQQAEKRPIAVQWDGVSGLLAGMVRFTSTQTKGQISITLPGGKDICRGRFQFFTKTKGSWSIACTDGMAASGTMMGYGKGKGSSGKGEDALGRKVRFSVGALN